jgi:hypothetical protein
LCRVVALRWLNAMDTAFVSMAAAAVMPVSTTTPCVPPRAVLAMAFALLLEAAWQAPANVMPITLVPIVSSICVTKIGQRSLGCESRISIIMTFEFSMFRPPKNKSPSPTAT